MSDILEFDNLPPGYSVTWEVCPDDSGMGYPWDEHDGHGIIRVESPRYNKAPGEIILHRDRGDTYIYDIRATLPIARRDGWGLGESAMGDLARKLKRSPTRREIAAESVRQDVEYCRGWLVGRYSWVGIVVKLCDPDGELIEEESVWGFEFDDYGTSNDYLESEARSMARGLIVSHGLDIDSRRAAWRAALREARETRYWQARGLQTLGG